MFKYIFSSYYYYTLCFPVVRLQMVLMVLRLRVKMSPHGNVFIPFAQFPTGQSTFRSPHSF